MKNNSSGSIGFNEKTIPAKPFVQDVIDFVREPIIVLDPEKRIVSANNAFYKTFLFEESDLSGYIIYDIPKGPWNIAVLKVLLEEVLPEKGSFSEMEIPVKEKNNDLSLYSLSARKFSEPSGEGLILLSFHQPVSTSRIERKETFSVKNIESILSHAPAMICILRGPDHVYELANDQYYQMVGHRDILGKPVREAVPEAEGQGFFELLDEVRATGNPYKGFEAPIELKINSLERKKSFLDFVYQPIFDSNGKVDGIFVYVVDVTEKVLARKKIEESESELRRLIDTVPAMIWITNESGESVYLNKNWYDYTGQKPEEALGFGWRNAAHPEDKELAEKSFKKANLERNAYSVTFRVKTKTGEYRWVIDSGRPKYSSDGEYEGMMGTVVDVHQEKMKEKVLADVEYKYEELIHSSPSLIATFKGRDFIVEIANDAIIETWGKGNDVIGKPLLEMLPELTQQGMDKILNEVYTTGIPYKGYEMPIEIERHGKRELFHFNFIFYPQRDAQGNIVGIVDIATEVTPQALLNKTLKESESHFRLMADLMPDKVTNTDAKGNFIYFNKNWLDYTGLSSEQLKENGYVSFIHPYEKKEFENRWLKSLATGSPFEMELRLLNRNGKYRWHLNRAEAVKDELGKIKMWIGTSIEIQRIKEEERRKGDFLKMVSHELKTPVTSIKGYVQLLLKMLKNGEDIKMPSFPLKPSLERIDHQINRLTRLISEMLDLSKIEENKLELRKEIFSLNDLVTETIQDIVFTNTQHNIQVIHDYKCMVFADKDRIGQVLINLVINAIKYSPDSKDIMVNIKKYRKNQVAVSVKDQGIGIDKKNHKNVFKRFYRIGGKSEETYSGFGIGLYLANEIIQRHKGSITLKSKKGKGSEFCFTLSVVKEKNKNGKKK